MGIRGPILAKGKAREATLEAVITRADGTVERLGVVSYWHRNPLKRWAWRLYQLWMRKDF
jgi:hypothetical protein